MKLQLINTSDGSHTIYVPDLNEQYHSVNGAITESNYVYLENGFLFYTGDKPTVFEVGFGTGLNSLLTALASEQLKKVTTYYSVEKFPLEKELVNQLNYGERLSKKALNLFHKIHDCEWNTKVKISEHFYLNKINNDLIEVDYDLLEPFNIIYFDAFGPDKQPEMWTSEIFQKISDKTLDKGIFVTYSAKGEVRRKLTACGFEMERLPGPPGKNQMLRGIKRVSHS